MNNLAPLAYGISPFYALIESAIEYRPPSIIGRIYKICVLLGQLLLEPKCSPKLQTLVEK